MVAYRRPPSMKIDKFQVRYKQVPYDNRYFFVYYDGQEIAKVPYHLEQYDLVYKLMDIGRDRRWEIWYNFLGRVERYNEYLDNKGK